MIPVNRRHRPVPPPPPPETVPIAELGLALRAVNALEDERILTVGEALKKSGEQLLKIENLGKQTVAQLVSIVAEMGVEIPEDWKALVTKRKKRR